MNRVTKALKVAKKCKKCGGYLEPKFGDHHPICRPEPTALTGNLEGKKQ